MAKTAGLVLVVAFAPLTRYVCIGVSERKGSQITSRWLGGGGGGGGGGDAFLPDRTAEPRLRSHPNRRSTAVGKTRKAANTAPNRGVGALRTKPPHTTPHGSWSPSG